MKARHKIPTIFNLSMVDVLCCALGCVILLWLVNFREAKRKASVAGETSVLLDEARSRLSAAEDETADARQRLSASEKRLQDTLAARDAAQAQSAALSKERSQLKDDLAMARTKSADLSKDITALKTQVSAAEDKLLKKTLDYAALTKDKDAAAKQLESQQKLLKDKDALAKAAALTIEDLTDRLRDNETKTKKLQLFADQVPKLKDEVAGYRDKLATSENRLTALQKDLGEQRVMIDKAVQARLAAENRFAGIELTGKRVVFLVDMSGSMDYVDEKTRAPDKWLGVRESLVKIARSLPQLEKYQVVVFSDKATFLFPGEEAWISYDPKTSPQRVMQTLAATKPQGNTNMYAAFEAAFRFRAEGLDTIYLLSDGLPNIGAGLSLERSRNLTELERSTILSQHVLRTLRQTWNRPTADKSRVRIHAVGFFYESPDVGAFLWALARENDGGFVGMSKP
jgi:hypothetical protein